MGIGFAVILAISAGTAETHAESATTTPQSEVPAPEASHQPVGSEGSGPALSLRIAADRDSVGRAGEAVHYSLTMFNESPSAIADITVEGGTLPPICEGGGGHVVAHLPPGGSERCEGVHVVTQEDLDRSAGGRLDVVFTAHAGNVSAQSRASIPLDIRPSLVLARSYNFVADAGMPDAADRGDTIAHVYVVTNSGNVTIDDVFVSDRHDGAGIMTPIARETMIHDAPPQGDSTDRESNDGKWSRLAPGDTVLFAATYEVTQADMDRQAGGAGGEDDSGEDDRDTSR